MDSEQARDGIDGQADASLAGAGHPARVGHYRLDGVVGRGEFGLIYKGHDERLDRVVAIKTLEIQAISDAPDRDDLLRRFEVEARTAARCFHPNIVTVFDFIEHDGAPYLIMEYVHAGTLEEIVASGTMLPINQVGDVCEQLLLALEHAHSKGVIHRDIKPANILCPSPKSIKVTDFGIARFDALGMSSTGDSHAFGTPNYMAPEQFLCQPSDMRTDLYAAGVILFQLLAGARPFVAGSLAELMDRVLNEPVPSLSNLRPGNWQSLDAVVQRALAREPGDRFQSAQEFASTLLGAITLTEAGRAAPLDLSQISMASLEAQAVGGPTDGGRPDEADAPLPDDDTSQSMAARLKPATLAAIEKSLAASIGPIARLVVRKASEQAMDMQALVNNLCGKIADTEEAARFRQEAMETLLADRGVADVRPRTGISPADMKAAEDALVVFVGPVARVLARRVAESEASREGFLRKLAETIPDEQQRAEFLAAVEGG